MLATGWDVRGVFVGSIAMVHFVRARSRAAAEQIASMMVDRQRPLCLSSRHIPGDADVPAWKVETIECCGEALSSAKPVTLIAWRAPRG